MPSLYEISIPVFIKNLKVLALLLNKGIEHVGEDKVSVLLESRLIEDMHPLIYQIRKFPNSLGPLNVKNSTPLTIPQKESATRRKV